MKDTRTAASVATRLATVLTHDTLGYGVTQWELVSVAPAEPYGHQVIMRDTGEDAEYVITVYRRSTVPAIPANVEPQTSVLRNDFDEVIRRRSDEMAAEAEDASQEVPF